nr:ABC transporter ATP-binding protein [Brevibacterium luteolum]
MPNDSILDILTGIDVDVYPRDHVGIVGRSGTGKSTLLNILGLLDRPTSGGMWFAGTEVSRIAQRKAAVIRGRDIGFVFQQFNLLPGRTALENVEAPLLYGTPSEFWQRRKLATRALERLGLGHRLNQLPIALSGGEQQRVAIARAIVRSPRVLLADEPTGALDVDTGLSVMRLLEKITSEGDCSLITITHDPNIAAMAGRRFQLKDGHLHLLETATAAEVASHLGGGAA